MRTLVLRSRQRTRPIDTKLLRQVMRAVLSQFEDLDSYELGIHLVAAEEMACLNETFLQHSGSTDVITFNHDGNGDAHLHGEIFISVDDAVAQAREFRTSWQAELTRYAIHGVLHLRGYDDLTPAVRRRMKREEGRLLDMMAREFTLSKLARSTKLAT